jgi:DNA-binding GntR family transcriptional regulator
LTSEVSEIGALLQSSSLRSRVESSLASAIISGKLAPGTLVSVPTLAAQFAVSATPVREAMLNLEKRGFVESVKNKGFRVTEVSEHDLVEIAQLRRWVEAPAMAAVAEGLKDVPLERFHQLAEQIVASAEEGDLEAYLDADSAFHSALLTLTGNERLVEFVAELRRQTRMVGLDGLRHTAELERSAHEHLDLLNLLERGDAEGARHFMEHHIGHVLGWWAGVAESAEEPGAD